MRYLFQSVCAPMVIPARLLLILRWPDRELIDIDGHIRRAREETAIEDAGLVLRHRRQWFACFGFPSFFFFLRFGRLFDEPDGFRARIISLKEAPAQLMG